VWPLGPAPPFGHTPDLSHLAIVKWLDVQRLQHQKQFHSCAWSPKNGTPTLSWPPRKPLDQASLPVAHHSFPHPSHPPALDRYCLEADLGWHEYVHVRGPRQCPQQNLPEHGLNNRADSQAVPFCLGVNLGVN